MPAIPIIFQVHQLITYDGILIVEIALAVVIGEVIILIKKMLFELLLWFIIAGNILPFLRDINESVFSLPVDRVVPVGRDTVRQLMREQLEQVIACVASDKPSINGATKVFLYFIHDFLLHFKNSSYRSQHLYRPLLRA